jgi:hypothetical protein
VKFAMTVICMLILALTAIEGRAQETQSADPSQIVALLQKHDNALNQLDLDGIMSVFAPSANIVVLGTGPGERWSGKDEIKGAYTEIVKDFDKGTATHDCYWKRVKFLVKPRGLRRCASSQIRKTERSASMS